MMDTSIIRSPTEDCDDLFGTEPCNLTHEDVAHFEDDNDPDRPDLEFGWGIRLSELRPFEFWTYFDRFVRYWPKKSFHVKYAYPTGFYEKKRRGRDQALPLFESLAVEMTERHLDADSWSMWRKRPDLSQPIWLGLHTPKRTKVDCIDIDAKKYLLGYYREGWSDKSPLMPVVHLPLDHFKMLKRIYDQFPGRVWCISSETLGIHAWKKHNFPQPTFMLHRENKDRLAAIGLGDIEAHPMPGRCLRRPFGADYRTITPTGLLTCWVEQLKYFETDGGTTPTFFTICTELVKAMLNQWRSWERASDVCGPKKEKVPCCRRDVLKAHRPELKEIVGWLKAGCPLEPMSSVVAVAVAPVIIDPTLRLCQSILGETLGETDLANLSAAPLRSAAQEAGFAPLRLPLRIPCLRGGRWAKELLRLARVGLEEEDSIGLVTHEMAKWLWWVELYTLPEETRKVESERLLAKFVLKKHNGFVTRLNAGMTEEVISQIARCVSLAARITDQGSLDIFARIRGKWSNGGYKYPVRLVPVLGGEEDTTSSSPCLLTLMCINFDDPLPEDILSKIKAKAGRSKVIPFSTRLINRLYNSSGKAYLGRTALTGLLGYKNPSQVRKYVTLLEEAGIIYRGQSYCRGRNGKLFTLTDEVMAEMRQARAQGVKEGHKPCPSLQRVSEEVGVAKRSLPLVLRA